MIDLFKFRTCTRMVYWFYIIIEIPRDFFVTGMPGWVFGSNSQTQLTMGWFDTWYTHNTGHGNFLATFGKSAPRLTLFSPSGVDDPPPVCCGILQMPPTYITWLEMVVALIYDHFGDGLLLDFPYYSMCTVLYIYNHICIFRILY